MNFLIKVLLKIIDIINWIATFIHVLWVKFFETIRHSWERFGFKFLKISYITYSYGGKELNYTKLYLKDGIIHTVECIGSDFDNGSGGIDIVS
jgi:hypothetical protein